MAVLDCARAKHAKKKVPDQGDVLAWIRELPAHQHHEGKAEEEKNQAADSVLDADHFVVGRDDVFPPERQLVMLVPVLVMVGGMLGACRAGAWRRRMFRFGGEARGCVHSGK